MLARLTVYGLSTIGGRSCASFSIGRIMFPFRCEYWFKYKGDYFIADSEDRSAKVLRRTVKR